jgi:carbon storage regulator
MSLILTRRLNEQIVINGNIRICVTQVKGQQLRFAIDAPRDITVNRAEVEERMQQESPK